MREFLDVPFEIKSTSLTDDGTFEGYASVFGDAPDSYGDVVEKGAFKDTIAAGGRNGFGIAMLWQHDSKQPIGTWKEISEDKKGLHVIGKLTRGVQKADEALLLMKDAAIRGLSIGYDILDYRIVDDRKTGKSTRFLKSIMLYEISPVVFPALISAQITNVKEMIRKARDERALEKALREAGLTRGMAADIVFMCKPYLREIGKNKSESFKDVVVELRKMNLQFAK